MSVFDHDEPGDERERRHRAAVRTAFARVDRAMGDGHALLRELEDAIRDAEQRGRESALTLVIGFLRKKESCSSQGVRGALYLLILRFEEWLERSKHDRAVGRPWTVEID